MALADQLVERLQRPSAPLIQQTASTIYSLGAMKYPKEFQKWEPEIQKVLSQVPRENWTLDAVDLAVKIVRADHLADYRSEWEQEFTAKMEPTMRSIGNAGTVPVSEPDKSHSLESDAIPPEWKLRAQKAGITERTIEEFCRANEMTRAEFFKQFAQGDVLTEGAPA